MSKLYTYTLECAGECGAKIELVSRQSKIGLGDLLSCAEVIGWVWVDKMTVFDWTQINKDKKPKAFCQFCVEQARMIVKTVGP